MKKIVLIFLFTNFYILAYNQVIKGTVLENKTRNPILATVYFNGTFVGTQSDLNGNFELDISKNTSMPLTISSIGYYSVTLSSFSTNKPLMIFLTPKVYEVKEVVISSKSLVMKRRANLNLFKNVFLGTTANARKCKIINENDITFNYDSDRDTLKALASNPLLIVNSALGYKMTYYLDRFEYSKRDRSMLFTGTLIFKEDLANEETNNRLYERRRKNAYLGSRMHFFRALWANKLTSTGFIVRNSIGNSLFYKDIVEESNLDSQNNYIKFLKSNEKLSILYYTKLSYIVLNKGKVDFDKDGFFDKSGLSISWEGEMMDQRVGDMLPYNYVIKY